jgi:hypothetical protein
VPAHTAEMVKATIARARKMDLPGDKMSAIPPMLTFRQGVGALRETSGPNLIQGRVNRPDARQACNRVRPECGLDSDQFARPGSDTIDITIIFQWISFNVRYPTKSGVERGSREECVAICR